MFSHKQRMYFAAFAAIALISVVLASFRGGMIPRLLAERVLPSSLSPAPSLSRVKEQPMSRTLVALKAPQPTPDFVLTSERFVNGVNKPPAKPPMANK